MNWTRLETPNPTYRCKHNNLVLAAPAPWKHPGCVGLSQLSAGLCCSQDMLQIPCSSRWSVPAITLMCSWCPGNWRFALSVFLQHFIALILHHSLYFNWLQRIISDILHLTHQAGSAAFDAEHQTALWDSRSKIISWHLSSTWNGHRND